MTFAVSRRVVIATTAGATALPVLSGCGSDDGGQTQSPAEVETGTVLVATDDVPIGGCAVNGDLKVVVTQPTEGEFKAFSAVCTHQGCLVVSSSDGEIPCTCHGSRFSLTDGAVLDGPATEGLAEVEISVADGAVSAI